MKNVHFIGIGGISMSALAQILLKRGYSIHGSDMTQSYNTVKLSELGATIYIGHSSANIKNPDIIVYTAAISEENPELIRAREYAKENKNVILMDRATLLGKIMKDFKYSICVAGTHGKTTTTSMLGSIMQDAGLDPTIHVGGQLDAIGGNVRTGSSDFFVSEACEYVESFLKFFPYIGLILNVEADHLDYYKDLNHVKSAFTKFSKLIPKDGYCIVCSDNQNALDSVKDSECNIITFAIDDLNADIIAKDITLDPFGIPTYTLYEKGCKLGSITLTVPGTYNIYNSLAAIACARIFKVDFQIIKTSFLEFAGAHRRFEHKGYYKNALVVDDYAHHPTEIKSLLNAAKNTEHNRVIAIFQPHTYTRTKTLLTEFSESFDDADEIIITDIYAAREKDNGTIHSKDLEKLLLQRGKNVIYIKEFEDILGYLEAHLEEKDLLLTIGAGTVYRIGEQLVQLAKV